MLHILLLILKIIGIVLFAVLGILLLGIACALFVPVRYRIEAVRREGEGEPPVTVRVKVTWLLHLVNVLVRFDGTVFVRVRIFIVTVFRMPQKEGHRKKRKKEGGEQGRQKRLNKREESEKQGRQEEQKKREESENRANQEEQGQKEPAADAAEAPGAVGVLPERRAVKQETAEEAPEEVPQAWLDEVDPEASANTRKKPGLWDKLQAAAEIVRTLFAKIKGLFENIQYTISRLCDKIRSVSDTIEYYRKIVEGEPFKRSFALCKDELLTVIKSLRPRKFEASFVVGMDDPASTGEILAVCGMLYPIIGGHVDVRGDFENKRLEGQALIVGKLRMFTFLRTAVRIYFNKDIRKLYRLLKKEAVNG